MSGSRVTTILHLGGAVTRILRTVHAAGDWTRAQVIISGEADPAFTIGVLDGAGIPRARFELDYRAGDTLENFTTTRARVLALGTTHLVVVTQQNDDSASKQRDHMRRALRIARWVYKGWDVQVIPFGDFTPIGPATQARETWWSHTRDACRAAVWYHFGWVIPIVGSQRVRERMRLYAIEASRILGRPVRSA